MVLANPEIARLPDRVIGRVAASFFSALHYGYLQSPYEQGGRRQRHGRRHAAQLRDCPAGQPFTPKSPRSVAEMVERIRIPRCAGKAHEISV